MRSQSGLTVQLHQILCISNRRQGLYKHCRPHHSDSAICIHILPLQKTKHKNSRTLLSLLLSLLSVSRVCDVIVAKQMWGFSHRAPSSPSHWSCLNAARWTPISSVMKIMLNRFKAAQLSCCPDGPKLRCWLSVITPCEHLLSTGGLSAVLEWRVQQQRDMKPWQAATVRAWSQDLPFLPLMSYTMFCIPLSH